MAKQLVNPFERHIEKLVLGIAALILVGVLIKFVFSSPNKLPLGSEPATPGDIDARLSQKADEILQRMKDAQPKSEPYDSKVDEFSASLAPIKTDALAHGVALAPDVPLVDAPDVASGRAPLVSIPAPPKPHVVVGRNTLLISNPQTGEVRTPADWVMLAIPFDVKAQSERQRRDWGATMADVIFATPEVQRRAQRSDGSWSDDDWQTINPWPALKMPDAPSVRLMDDRGKIIANKDDQKAVARYVEELSAPLVQLAALRPLPPTFTRDENPWKFPLVSTYEEVVKQDQEYLFPNDPAAAVEDRYGLKVSDAGKPKSEPKTPAQVVAQEFEDARVLLENARKIWSSNDALRAYNAALGITTNKDATPEIKNKAQKLMKEAETLAEDIRRNPRGGAQQAAGASGKEPDKRARLGKQEIWAYDAAAGSIVNGATYQYRIRVRVLNRLAGFPESFADPKNAAVMIVAGEWSEPTDPIVIPQDSVYFVTREDKNRREVHLEFFRWYDGVWVKTKSAVNFKEGDAITHQELITVPGLDSRTEAARTTVDFSEDLTLLDIDFSRSLRERKSGSAATGVKFAPQPTTSAAAVFVDGSGRLHERVVAIDKENPLKKKIVLWNPGKQASVP